MKKFQFISLALLSIAFIAVGVVDCNAHKTDIPAANVRRYPALNSSEAASAAYAPARKWNADAVLFRLSAPAEFMDYHWSDNDRSWAWSVQFARPGDDKIFSVEIADDQVSRSAEDAGAKRQSPPPPHPAGDHPGISMRDAAKAALAAGAPQWERPENVYSVDSPVAQLKGRPVWTFSFLSTRAHYDVDGTTGRLLSVRDMWTGKTLSSSEYTNRPPGKDAEAIKEANVIYEFFDAIDRGQAGRAVAMMDNILNGSVEAKKTWKQNFQSLELIQVKRAVLEPRRKWHNNRPIYAVDIFARPKKGGPPFGWEEGDNRRWITISRSGDTLLIRDIATGP